MNFLSHSYNPNGIYRLRVSYKPEYDDSNCCICLNTANDMRLRDWQRFSNCKHFDLIICNNRYASGIKSTSTYQFSATFINGVLNLKHLLIFNCRVDEYDKQVVDFIEKLSQSNSTIKNIKEFTFYVSYGGIGKFGSPCYFCQFNLENCEKCVLSNVYFKVILSNKCNHLALNYNVLKKNFDYSKQEDEYDEDENISDLSGVKTLVLNQAKFCDSHCVHFIS